MIGTTAEKIGLEIEAGVRERDKKLAVFRSQLRRYVSPFYESDMGDSDEDFDPENHIYETLSFTVPQLAFSNPRVSLKSRVFGADQDISTMRYLLNAWVQDSGYGEKLVGPAYDLQFNFCAGITTREDHPYLQLEDGSPAKTCVFKRLSQRHYVRDPGALTKEEARWEAHEWHMDKEDLIALAEEDPEGGWDLEVIKSLPEHDDADLDQKHNAKVPDRKQVRCYDFWVKDAITDDPALTRKAGFHGVIFTLAAYKDDGASKMDFIREPRAFYGPPEGPYSFQWVHYVPDDAYGLSNLVAIEGQVRDLNLHARTMSRRAANRKRPLIVDEMEVDGVAQKLQDAIDDEVVGIPGFDNSKIANPEIGGLTDQDIAYTELARKRLERVSGLSEQQRGIAGEADSATEAAIAKEGGDIRLEWTKLQFQRFARDPLRKVAWYFHHDEEMRHALPPEAAEELGAMLLPGQYLIVAGGNPTIPFDQLGIEIEPLSMERTTTASNQRRATELFGLVTQIAQMVPTMPWVKWGDLLDQLGDAYNVPRMGELIDLQMASLMAQVPILPGTNNPAGAASQSRPAGPPPALPAQGQRQQRPDLGVISSSPYSGFSQGQKSRQQAVGA